MNGDGHAGHMPQSGRGMAISAWLTGVYFVIELAIGLWTGSIAVISDAFHTFAAVGGVLVAIIAARLARRPADEDRSFGWYRAEIIGALVNGGLLLAMASVLIIITALVIKFTGFLLIGPILGMAFGFVLVWASWGILRDSMHLLMEGTPGGVSLPEITRMLEALDGVADAHHVHAWALTSGKHVFSGHLRVREGTDPQDVLKAAHGMLRDRFGFFFVTLQVEDRCLDESGTEPIDITRNDQTGAG